METSRLKAHLKEKILKSEGELLSLISMFIYNWTEGPWTPPPLTKEQIKELQKRIEEVEKGEVETLSWEEMKAEFEEKYDIVFERGEEYQNKREKKDRDECIGMLEYISREHLILLDMFLESHHAAHSNSKLSEEELKAIQRSRKEFEEGRFMDAFEFLDSHS
ncbi:MAG: hypothetical protein CL666_08090 [Balneola sp.]|nr:hypothetical protein [Balneola sp.]|tara:strand:- start:18866 stop:19354 length:489 start_codon:yes stop_codon:yes gene_type:complete